MPLKKPNKPVVKAKAAPAVKKAGKAATVEKIKKPAISPKTAVKVVPKMAQKTAPKTTVNATVKATASQRGAGSIFAWCRRTLIAMTARSEA